MKWMVEVRGAVEHGDGQTSSRTSVEETTVRVCVWETKRPEPGFRRIAGPGPVSAVISPALKRRPLFNVRGSVW